MRHLIRRAWWIRRVGGLPQVSRVHLYPEAIRGYAGPWTALCGQRVPWHLRPQYEPDGLTGELFTDPGPEVETRPCRRCERYARALPP